MSQIAAIHALRGASDPEYRHLASQVGEKPEISGALLSSSVPYPSANSKNLPPTPSKAYSSNSAKSHKWLNFGQTKGIEVWKNDIVVRRKPVPRFFHETQRGTKSELKYVSAKSIRNAQFVIANTDVEFPSMITLTYPETYPTNGQVVTAHWNALKRRIWREFGEDLDYFLVREFQKRGAPHLHIAVSIDLRLLGEVTRLERGNVSRRRPAFETVKSAQDWLFEAWVAIITPSGPNWAGLSEADILAMKQAYFEYNSGVSWELMRKVDGGKRYMVKELSSLKEYQKTVPAGFEKPGRTFLYNKSVRPTVPKACYALDGLGVMELLRTLDFRYLPDTIGELCNVVWNMGEEVERAAIEFSLPAIDQDELSRQCESKPGYMDLQFVRTFYSDGSRREEPPETPPGYYNVNLNEFCDWQD